MTTPINLDHLNEPQRAAVEHTEGPLLVLAGAGAGKTRVITQRIAYLIHKGVAPHHILAVTFTNKAASEMRERVHQLLTATPGTARASLDTMPLLTTFHSLGVRLLREHHATLHIHKNFSIYDRSDSVKTVKHALEQAGYNIKQFEPRKILSNISRAKGEGMTRASFADNADSYIERVTAEAWQHYETKLRSEQALDFDDLLLKTYLLLHDYPIVRSMLQDRFRYIHVDEYQDTNKVQFNIVKLLAGEQQNICVVGDVDQNIYSWRGADISNVLKFEKIFPTARTVFLEENYRSTQTIINASNQVIAKNNARIPKTVFTNNEVGDPITVMATTTGIDEAEYIVATASTLIENGVSPSDIAVLYRTNFQSRALEEAFLQNEVPYQLLGTKFFERKEIKDALAYVRLALNPESTTDLARIINVPTRGIGKVTLLKLLAGERATLTGATDSKVAVFEKIMEDIRGLLVRQPISVTLAYILERTGIEENLLQSGTEDDLERLENLRELVSLSTRYDELDGEASAIALIENAALQTDQDELGDASERPAVRLMTIHAAKGLEFPYVFISGLEEGLFPHERLDEKAVDEEEERRLFYVALTRAATKIYLTYAHVRTIFGSQRANVASSFLSDIDIEYLELPETLQHSDTSSGFERVVLLD